MKIQEEENKVRALYHQYIDRWNHRDAEGMAVLLANKISMVGFDGSQMNSAKEILDTFRQIFNDHFTAAFVTIIREVRFLGEETALLRAAVGMVPSGHADINPNVNAIQTMIALKESEQWRITLFQNTPAALHGQPQMSAELTMELRQALSDSRAKNN